MDYSVVINGCTLEYIDDCHLYLVDGIIVPSVTQLLKKKFGGKYANVDKKTLTNAANRGTEIHKAIEEYCTCGTESDLVEVKNFQFLEKAYNFSVNENETPVILFKDNRPIAAGRLDLVIEREGKVGGADIKCTSSLDKEYLAYQLNIYRIAYEQNYGIKWQFLYGIHLKGDTRKVVDIPINEDIVWELINEDN